MRRTLLMASAALVGIAASVAVAYLASQLAAPRVGLLAEPLSVASGLAPTSIAPPTSRRTTTGSTHSKAPAQPSTVRHRAPAPAQSTATPPSVVPMAPTTAIRPAPSTPSSPPPVTPTAVTRPAVTPAQPATHSSRDDSGGGASGDSTHQRDD